MQITLNENQVEGNGKIFYLKLDDIIVYYKEIVHTIDFIKTYQHEKPIFEFSAKVTVDTKRPFVTFKSKDRNSICMQEDEIVLIRVCKGNREVELVSKLLRAKAPQRLIKI